MVQVTIRDLLYNFSHYLKLVKEGTWFTILE
jgi:antitoxin (DNA-binding transcriptional repressor) of toxin-antitoxin stability system